MKNNTPQRRLTIDNNTISEIHSLYPPQESITGKYYKATLDYTTTETDFFEEEAVKRLIAEHGFAPIGFYELLRIEMAKSNGYGICKTNGDFEIFICSVGVKLGITERQVKKFISILTEYKLLLTIKGDNGEDEYYTTVQSVWNYEYRLYYRHTNREKQKKSRSRKKQNESAKSTPKASRKEPSGDFPFEPVTAPQELDIFDDLPFDDFPLEM